MEAIQKELDKLQKRLPVLLPPTAGASFRSGVFTALDTLIQQFEQVDAELAPWHSDSTLSSSTSTLPDLAALACQLEAAVDQSQKSVNTSQKEVYGALAKFGKAVEKVFPTSASADDSTLFTSEAAQVALKNTVMAHFMRHGDLQLFHQFADEAQIALSPEAFDRFSQLSVIQNALDRGELGPAITWATTNSAKLSAMGSSLAYALHRSVFLSLALGQPFDPTSDDKSHSDHQDGQDGDTEMVDAVESVSDLPVALEWSWSFRTIDRSSFRSTNVEVALNYGREYLSPYADTHLLEIQKLFAMLLFLPVCCADGSKDMDPGPLNPNDFVSFLPRPYRYLFDPHQMHAPYLIPLFEEAYCRVNAIPRFSPLKVATDIGANGTLHKILRVRTVMKESRTDWSQADELPVEVPLPPQLRFHSIFCCPVSKEQGCDGNPPMLMACGHAVCRESLYALAKGSAADRRVKCPYCPSESTVGQAMRVYF